MTETIRTIKIEITNLLDDIQKSRINDTIQDQKIVFDIFARLGIEHKSTSYQTLHKYGYEAAKQRCPDMNTATIQQCAKVPLFQIKQWNSRHKKDKWGWKGCKTSQSYPLNKLTLSERGDMITFSTNGERIRIIPTTPVWFCERYPTRDLQQGQVCMRKGRYFIALSYKVPTMDAHEGSVIGIDRGLYHPYATSDGILADSRHIHAVGRRYAYNKAVLQSKGTRSAKRHLKRMAGREMRFRRDVDHCMSRALAMRDDVSTYVLEDLTGLRDSKRGRKMNRWLHKWSTTRFQFFLTYKCEERGIGVVTVNPKYTSQICSQCGKSEKSNRRGNQYRCSCGFRCHQDINAQRNIRDRFLLNPEVGPGRIQPSERSTVRQEQSPSTRLGVS